MMKGRIVIVLVALLIIAFLVGCATIPTPPPQPLITNAVWESVTRDQVFDSCVKALHLQGYTLGIVDKSLGIIGTDWTFSEGSVGTKFRLSFLIFENTPGRIAVALNPKGRLTLPPGYHMDDWWPHVTNKFGKDIKYLFEEIERLIGKPPATTATSILE